MRHREVASMRVDYLLQSTVLPTVTSIRCLQNHEIRDRDEIVCYTQPIPLIWISDIWIFFGDFLVIWTFSLINCSIWTILPGTNVFYIFPKLGVYWSQSPWHYTGHHHSSVISVYMYSRPNYLRHIISEYSASFPSWTTGA